MRWTPRDGARALEIFVAFCFHNLTLHSFDGVGQWANLTALRTAAFTSFGLLGGRFARDVRLLISIVALVGTIYFAVDEGGANLFHVAAWWFVALTWAILALTWAQRSRHAYTLFRYGYYPIAVIVVWIASCQCSCTPGARCWKTQLENRPHRYTQCATEADWNSTELAVDGDLHRSCIYNLIGALVGTALLAAFAKWPRYQVFTFLGCLASISSSSSASTLCQTSSKARRGQTKHGNWSTLACALFLGWFSRPVPPPPGGDAGGAQLRGRRRGALRRPLAEAATWPRLVVVHVALSQGIRILNGLGKSTSTSGPKVVETPPLQ